MQLYDVSTVCICDIKIHDDRREPVCINLNHQKAENIHYVALVAQIKTFAHYEEDGETLAKHSNYNLFVEQLS